MIHPTRRLSKKQAFTPTVKTVNPQVNAELGLRAMEIAHQTGYMRKKQLKIRPNPPSYECSIVVDDVQTDASDAKSSSAGQCLFEELSKASDHKTYKAFNELARQLIYEIEELINEVDRSRFPEPEDEPYPDELVCHYDFEIEVVIQNAQKIPLKLYFSHESESETGEAVKLRYIKFPRGGNIPHTVTPYGDDFKATDEKNDLLRDALKLLLAPPALNLPMLVSFKTDCTGRRRQKIHKSISFVVVKRASADKSNPLASVSKNFSRIFQARRPGSND